ncbi:hypothetical protein [Mesoterricola sediminis]|uniref:Uncharacterized protein n=1 Tax=Mesoterricola sediminis TaxID=2927980 RepID=A0AA48H2H5_9BACT|nr:hypothetical protein [Mesoterricola sediminis]BDU78422.1 hypothetical protein METESE_33800 [Mesoterricola sediminis]
MAPASIHHRRRWFYVLWTCLLLLSLGALVLWNLPTRTDQASLQMGVVIPDAPSGARVQVWAGPRARCPHPAWDGRGSLGEAALGPAGDARLPLLRVPIARRRWVKDFIPGRTWEIVLLRVVVPGQPDKFIIYPLTLDIRAGLLGPGRKLLITSQSKWAKLRVEVPPPNGLP